MESVFTILNNKFKPQYNETIKSLQFHKLVRKLNENVEECMGRIGLGAADCNYKEVDTQLKEQFIYELNDNDMLVEIMRELTKTEDSKNVTNE